MGEFNYDKILKYCEARGITIPIGFRRGANRYAIIELTNPPKLVARTWFNQVDVVYFLNRHANETPLRILDFKTMEELAFTGGKRLKRIRKITQDRE
jgi:hypothetical protein